MESEKEINTDNLFQSPIAEPLASDKLERKLISLVAKCKNNNKSLFFLFL